MSEIALWAASGAMALTGRADGPPEVAPGRPATAVRDALDRLERRHPEAPLPDVRLLGERAAVAGLRRNAPWSCGGAFRALATRDGHLGLSLPRPTDVESVPALVEGPVEEPWAAVAAWAARTTTEAAVERARLLGLACTAVSRTTAGAKPTEPPRPPVVETPGGARHAARERPLVVDFTSLWAGPLCAHLVAACGADVVKVESTRRLDGARRGPAAFYDLLHAGHQSVTVDFSAPGELAALRSLVEGADLVLEASRPRALQRLGLHADRLVDHGVSWVSITAYGRDSDAVGFGDDVAAGAGLVTADRAPCGDALADPLAGVTAAAHAVEALHSDHAVLVDLSMHHVAAAASTCPMEEHEVHRRDDRWWVECADGLLLVSDPEPRAPRGRAAAAGEHNHLLATAAAR
ncbi:MAG TPA: CoA transferase [Nocardioides sp.]|nr:CoA transferase [Nocardioides sp.]HWJ82980.1 CoA transferase [Nocardioides sp.]